MMCILGKSFLDLFGLELVKGGWVNDLDDLPEHRRAQSMPVLVDKNTLSKVMVG